MSLFKGLIVRNFRKISPLHVSITLRCCSTESTLLAQKIPKISDDDQDNLLQFIDQYDTRPYDKRVKKNLYHQQKFMQVRKAKLEEMLLDANQYHPVIFSLLSAKSGAEILEILNTINNDDFPQHEVYEDADDEDILSDKNIKPTIHRIYCKAIRCCADLGEFDIGYKIFSKCKTKNVISNELYNTIMWCTMYETRNEKALQKVFNLYDELQQVIIDNKLDVHPRTYSTLVNSCIKVGHYRSALQVIDKVKVKYPQVKYPQGQSKVWITFFRFFHWYFRWYFYLIFVDSLARAWSTSFGVFILRLGSPPRIRKCNDGVSLEIETSNVYLDGYYEEKWVTIGRTLLFDDF